MAVWGEDPGVGVLDALDEPFGPPPLTSHLRAAHVHKV